MIAAKLHDGVSTNAILDCIRDNVHGKIGRAELVTCQDVHSKNSFVIVTRKRLS